MFIYEGTNNLVSGAFLKCFRICLYFESILNVRDTRLKSNCRTAMQQPLLKAYIQYRYTAYKRHIRCTE